MSESNKYEKRSKTHLQLHIFQHGPVESCSSCQSGKLVADGLQVVVVQRLGDALESEMVNKKVVKREMVKREVK